MAVSLLDLITGNLARQKPLPIVDAELDILRVGNRVERRGPQLALAIASNAAERLVDLQPVAVHVDERHPDRRIAERRLEALAHLLEIELRLEPVALSPL